LIALTLRRGDRLDLDLRTAARRLVVIGANGSGKTSLVRAVAGTDVRPDDRIVVGGVELSGLPPQDRGLALVATDPALAPRTPAAVVDLVLRGRVAGRAERARRVAELLAAHGCTQLAGRSVGTLSGGERIRVAAARAAAVTPALLLADEPLDRVAVPDRAAIRAQLAALAPLLLLATHSPDDVAAFAGEVAVLSAGRVVQVAPAYDVAAAPVDDYAAALVDRIGLVGTARGDRVALDGGGEVTLASPADGRVVVAVRCAAVALATEDPHGSARNVWRATVASLAPLSTGVLRIGLAGRPAMVAEVTAKAAADLGLAVGLEVVASVKATEIGIVSAERPSGRPVG
jgi:molybdopterin-binding protein